MARVLAALAAVLLLTSAFFLGLVMFLVLLGAGLILGIWVAWRTRKLRQAGGDASGRGGVIDGDYVVVSREERQENTKR